MSRKKKNPCDSREYWQSAHYNTQLYMVYEDLLWELALSRFEWHGLPETCDARYLEWLLLTEGAATIAKHPRTKAWMTLQAVQTGQVNPYDNPSSWEAYGQCANPHFKCNWNNAVWVWDSMLRSPLTYKINLWARRLALYDRVTDQNLLNQFSPWLLVVDSAQKNDATQIIKQVYGGEPAIIGTGKLRAISETATKIDLESEYIGERLQTGYNNLWSQIYTFMGIDSISEKSERMIESEVTSRQSPAELRRVSPLKSRRAACKKLERIGLEGVTVTWASEWQSANYDYTHKIERMAEDEFSGMADVPEED